ncbi:MAG: polysaccharide deacetylase family protein [Lachnospiraceae bacterium]|nr:polysaccharide deacetylase family protein [Lachnospiraceae bacterium]MBP3594377.1 polysaccharide deacetylase family protein [Lachnospiraceae bacterium]
MSGRITFHFDDGHMSHYEQAYNIFRKAGVVGCLALSISCLKNNTRITIEQALEMQENGWEILSHSMNHIRMSTPLPVEVMVTEIATCKYLLEQEGFHIKQYITPMSECHESMIPLLREHYDAAFTVYKNSAEESVEQLVMQRPVQKYRLHRACLTKHSLEELKNYVDYVAENDSWLVFYDHDLGVGTNITAQMLAELVDYCKQKHVDIVTSSEALAQEKCTTDILLNGYNGTECWVHARAAVNGLQQMITAQKLDVTGMDCFGGLYVNCSTDGGHTWSGFHPDKALASIYRTVDEKNLRSVCCDMTPMYHHKTNKFLVTGHLTSYQVDNNRPLRERIERPTPYAVYDMERGCFGEVQYIQLPETSTYYATGSGCCQCAELDNGDILIPITFQSKDSGEAMHTQVMIVRCSFDGESLCVKEISNTLDVPDEQRGIGECSVVVHEGKYYLTIRGDNHGYVSVNDNGLHFTQPLIWHWDNGEILPTYNTQAHWIRLRGKLYLVYTRKNGTNDHVFRHRAPLYAAEINTDTLSVIASSEFVVVPERGARLGNFGACSIDDNTALVTVTEWMQPKGCEQYGSDNALWLTQVI